MDYTVHSLGSYMGPLEYGYGAIFSKGLSGSPSTYKYLKTISDFSCRDGSGLDTCAKLMERVCEKLDFSKSVVGESVAIAKCVIEIRKEHGGTHDCRHIGVLDNQLVQEASGHKGGGARDDGGPQEPRVPGEGLGHHPGIFEPTPGKATGPRMAEEYLGRVLVDLQQSLRRRGRGPGGILQHALRGGQDPLENTDGPSRGGHNPRALAATAVDAGEMAPASLGGEEEEN